MDVQAARYVRYSWIVLGFNLFVILWGAYVRATGSGAGCGSHWPLCNGEVLPESPAFATIIEFGHRLTSGVALLMVVGLVYRLPEGFKGSHPVRAAAWGSLIFMVMEAAIGAGLVLLEYVADDQRIARGFWVAGHLANTFLLVACLALTAHWATRPPVSTGDGEGSKPALGAALGGLLLLGISGAITALGDTLFPVATLEEGTAQTFSATAHLFVRLRVWHPTLALVVGGAVLWAARQTAGVSEATRGLGRIAVSIYLAQLALGLLNVWLLAPVWLQLVHLLLSDLIWIALILLAAEVFLPGPNLPLLGRARTGRV